MTSHELTTPWDEIDDEILASIRTLHETLDPVPPGLADDVKFALTVQALHAQVAELTRLAPSGVRTTDYTRATSVTFSGADLTAMLTIAPAGPGRVRIDGWVTGGPAVIELREHDRTRTAETDESDRFAFDDVHSGMVQFVLYPLNGAGGNPVITPSFDV
jgi:hypothetical protein